MNDQPEKIIVTPYRICHQDRLSSFAHLGWRAALTLFTWFILGFGINTGNGFFVSLMLFATPLLFDYLRFKTWGWRTLLKRLEIIFSFSWFFIGIIGLVGILYIERLEGVFYIKVSSSFIAFHSISLQVKNLWEAIGFSIFFAIIDCFLYQNEIEEELYRQKIAKDNNFKQ